MGKRAVIAVSFLKTFKKTTALFVSAVGY
jgi:hypothetical protein